MKTENRLWKMENLGILAICTILLFVAVACSPSTQELSAPTAEPTREPSTPTSLPTKTLAPTNTVTPTNTLTPTKATPRDSYTTEFRARFGSYLAALDAYTDLIIEMELLPERVRDNEWKLKALEKLDILDQAANQLESIPDVTEQYTQLDTYLDAVATETHTLVENFSFFLEHTDKEAYGRATENLTNINAIMEDVIAEGKRVLTP